MRDEVVRQLLRLALAGDEDAGTALAVAHQRGAVIASRDLAKAAIRSRSAFALAWANALFPWGTAWELVTRNALEQAVWREVDATSAARRKGALETARRADMAGPIAELSGVWGQRKRDALRKLGLGHPSGPKLARQVSP